MIEHTSEKHVLSVKDKVRLYRHIPTVILML